MPDATVDERNININDPRLQQEMVEANPDADFFELPPPPPDDRQYMVKVMLGDKGIVAKRQLRKGDADGRPTGPYYLNAAIDCHILDPDTPWDGRILYENATSIIMPSSGTSLLHAILRALGYPALGKMPLTGPNSLCEHVLGVLSSEPTCGVEGKWEARAKDASGNYYTVKKGMRNFPLINPHNPEEGYSPLVDVIDPVTRRPTGEQARAQFRISKFFQPG
jgi:hypothetical protein